MSGKSLEDVLRATGDVVALLRNSPIGAYVYPVVPPEFSNWRDEQRAWRETAVLYDQSHHMAELMVEGPDAGRLLAGLAINSFADFPVDRAKHFVACSPDGHVIGDVIAFHLAADQYNLVGRVPTVNWVQFHGETGGFDVRLARDDRSPPRPGGKPVVRRHYRYQIQGPNAPAILERLNGGPVPDIRFFHLGAIAIAGRTVRALRHGMAGAPGLEVWGPYAEGDEVRDAILEAGRDLGLRQVGSRAYATNTLESGWIPSLLPAVYTGEAMRAYRKWLPADGYEATGSIGGSFVSRNIEDYYLTPHALGYASYIKLDRDFVGRAALERLAGTPQRQKVTFEWNADDVARVHRSMLEPGADTVQDHRPAARELRFVLLRRGDAGRPHGRVLDVQRLQLQRAGDDLARRRGPRRAAGRRADARLGRGGRRHAQDHRRAARADRDPRQGRAGALLAHGPRELRRRLAHGRLRGPWRGRRDRPTIPAERQGGARADRQGRGRDDVDQHGGRGERDGARPRPLRRPDGPAELHRILPPAGDGPRADARPSGSSSTCCWWRSPSTGSSRPTRRRG